METAGINSLSLDDRKNSLVIYINTPLETRIKRMKERGWDNEKIQERIAEDVKKFKDFKDYDLEISSETFVESNMIEFYKKDDVIKLLIDWGDLKKVGLEKIKSIKPGHGPCCTCQICGYHHDDCVCNHNEMVDQINNKFKVYDFNFKEEIDESEIDRNPIKEEEKLISEKIKEIKEESQKPKRYIISSKLNPVD
jgi:hypothetical protein